MMRKTFISLSVASFTLSLSPLASAEFLKDSKANVELRNFYFNRDFRQDTASQSKQEEWAQGFLMRYESGYTEGTVGVGFDAIGMFGLKLDSSPDRTGSGLLPRSIESPRRAQDDYSKLGATAKLKVSKSVVKIGTLMPKLPTVQSNDSRLLPQSFQGGQLNSMEIDGLTFDAGQLKQINLRDSSNNEDMTISSGGARGIIVRGGQTSDEFNFASLNYKWNKNTSTSYSYGGLDGLYKQNIVNFIHVLPLDEKQQFKSDLRYARSTDDGNSNVDNTALGAMFTYAFYGHQLGLGYQKMIGDTGYAYINGSDPFLVNFVQIGDFSNKEERSWQARYDFNFASVGIPGLTFMTRYISGDDVDLGSGKPSGKEWERNMDIAYVFQEGSLKNLGIKWRNAIVRTTNFGNDIDENRLILSYTLPLF
ncbi:MULTISPECIES: OprD family porin [Pseudomonas]